MQLLNGLRSWLGIGSRYRQHEDSFALDRAALWPAVRDAIQRQCAQRHSVWLVAHFPDTFEVVQDHLEAWGLPYDVVTEPLAGADWASSPLRQPGSLHLILASLIPTPPVGPAPLPLPGSTSVMLVERHPWPAEDRRVEEFCRACPFPIELGAFQALDDPVLKEVINDTTVMILEQLGMGRNDLIASSMVSRRLAGYLRKRNREIAQPRAADNAAQWLALNWHGDSEPPSGA